MRWFKGKGLGPGLGSGGVATNIVNPDRLGEKERFFSSSLSLPLFLTYSLYNRLLLHLCNIFIKSSIEDYEATDSIQGYLPSTPLFLLDSSRQ